MDDLYAQIGKLTTQNEWIKKNLVSKFTALQRRDFVDFKGWLGSAIDIDS